MEEMLKNYVELASTSEDLKSQERTLKTAIYNLKELKSLLIDKEKEFCAQDQSLRRESLGVKDSLRKRCFNLIDHLVHYKCVVECLFGDIITMGIDDYIHLSLLFRDTELTILQAIKLNQQRNELFLNMHDEEAQSCLADVEYKWRVEHQDRRQILSKLILDHSQFIVDELTKNLQQQHSLLNLRYQSINTLIRSSYDCINKN